MLTQRGKVFNIEEILKKQTKINVLYLDDDCLDHKIMEHALRASDEASRYTLKCTTDIQEAKNALDTGHFHVFILDNKMPSSPNFHETLDRLNPIPSNVRVIVASSEVKSSVFTNTDHLDRKPDAVVEKFQIRQKIEAGLLLCTQ